MNYFEILDIPIGYGIDEDALTRSYLRRQALVHPDVGDPDSGGAAESGGSALLNQAYKILMNPVERARHFLEIHGMLSESLDNSSTIEAFNLREKYDSLTNPGDKKQFHGELRERISRLIEKLRDLEDNLDEFQKNYAFLRFLRSFLEKVESDVYDWN
jgi:molecular chaperone HscB